MSTTDPDPALPWAARQQLDVATWETQLVDRARQRGHLTIAWWWGPRWVNGRYGALCYCCDQLVATWASAHPMTREAARLVAIHAQAERWSLDGAA